MHARRLAALARPRRRRGATARPSRLHRRGAPEAAAGRDARPFRQALVISLLNPKAILFFISFFIQFVDPGYA